MSPARPRNESGARRACRRHAHGGTRHRGSGKIRGRIRRPPARPIGSSSLHDVLAGTGRPRETGKKRELQAPNKSTTSELLVAAAERRLAEPEPLGLPVQS